ncbi:spore-associated protein A [Streptomyces sp. GMY02]|uniref:spore-associated protein A n=1 Tax=Streptomyces sp. GMY02 TaxID=1333528 RepID=UPI0020B74BEE|nr:spore-associated protein A [Streptomyces sp. GMY02]
MRKSRRVSAVAALAALAVGGSVTAVAQPAVAAPAAVSAQAAYNGVCGAGYGVVNWADVGRQGTVYLTYNPSNGKNCVVTIRKTSGSPVNMFSYIMVPATGEGSVDSDYYTSYAGPVYAYARGLCVDWAGGISNQDVWTYGSNCGARTATRVIKNGETTIRSKVAEPSAARAGVLTGAH